MKVKQLKSLLANLDDNADIVFAEYQDGHTVLWWLSQCCNTERQAEFGQVWFSRNLVATDLMAKNDAIFAKESD